MKITTYIIFAIVFLFIWVGINTNALLNILSGNVDTDQKPEVVAEHVNPDYGDILINENERVIETATGKIIVRTLTNPELREYRLTRRTVTAGPFLFHDSADFYTDGYFPEDVKHNAEYIGLLSHGGQELGDALTSIHGVAKATLSYYVVRINKEKAHEWKDIEPLILSLLKAFEDENSSSSGSI